MDYFIITKLFILQKKNLQMNAGLRIKKIREYRNFTQQYMADNLEISQNAYSKIVRSPKLICRANTKIG
jgi:DNA-binding transcriptional regulator YiaG